jgi:hypothetical protein
MKRIFFPTILSISLVLCSCSKQITSLVQANRMINTEFIAHNPTIITSSNTGDRVINLQNNITVPQPEVLAASAEKIAKPKTTRIIRSLATAAHVVTKAAGKEIKSQVNTVTNFAVNHHLASYSGANKTMGLGGIAAICAVGAIAMAVLGITQMGHIYWILSVILIIAAVVFFLVYLMGKAAAPSHGGE